jgi:hypothetical protein
MNSSIRLDSPGTLSDNRLIRQVEFLRGKEREVLAGVLRHLDELERRRLYLPRGYSSLFEFCTQHLKYSRSAAGRRIASARTLARFPMLEEYLLKGEINLYSLSLVSGILTEKNFRKVLHGIRNRSTREVEALAAAYRPGRVLKDRVKPVCVMVPETGGRSGNRLGAGSAPGRSTPGAGGAGSGPGSSQAVTGPGTGSASSGPRTGSTGSSPGAGFGNDIPERVRMSRKYKFEFAVNREFKEKFDRMRALLSSRYPQGISFEDLFMLLMDEYIERHSPEGRAARRERREASRTRRQISEGNGSSGVRSGDGGKSGSGDGGVKEPNRSIPAKVRDEVFLRDGGRCTFKGSDGRRCNSQWDLQIDHIVPFALGGDSSPGNLRLLCGKHNRMEAGRVFGSDHMERFRKQE